MLYLDYEWLKAKYLEAQKQYDDILSEKEALFAKTQPKAIQYDKEAVKGGKKGNAFESYMIKKEEKKIDERLSECKELFFARAELLQMKEKELRASKQLYDRIYCMRILDRYSAEKIAAKTNYSNMHIYRKIEQIQKMLQNVTKAGL